MAPRRKDTEHVSSAPRRPPSISPEVRENQLTSLAVDLAEKQLRDGSASSQVITHYLKVASSRERLEKERLALENELSSVKIEAIRSAKRVEELYSKALDAMRSYAGQEPLDSHEDSYED